jgi:hypothetical protein
VKGIAFKTTLHSLGQMLPPTALAAVTAALPAETARWVSDLPSTTEWIAAAHIVQLFDTAHRVGFSGDLTRSFELGRVGMRANLKGVHSVFVKVFNPSYVIGRSAAIWETYYRRHGTVLIAERGETHVTCHYKDMSLGCAPYWEVMRGALFALAEATRMRTPRVETVDGGGASSFAFFRIGWT